MRQLLNRLQALPSVVAAQQAGSQAALQQGSDLPVLFSSQRFFYQRQALGIRLGGQLLGGLAARLHIAAAQRQRGLCRVDDGAQIVVADDLLGIGRELDGCAGRRIADRIAADHIGPALGHAHFVVGQRLEIGREVTAAALRIGCQHGLIDGLHALLGVVCRRHGIGLLGRQCVTGKAQQGAQPGGPYQPP